MPLQQTDAPATGGEAGRGGATGQAAADDHGMAFAIECRRA